MNINPVEPVFLALSLTLVVTTLAALIVLTRAWLRSVLEQGGWRVVVLGLGLAATSLAVRVALPAGEPVDMVEVERVEWVKTNAFAAGCSTEYAMLRPILQAVADPLAPLKAVNLATGTLAPLLLAWLIARWANPLTGLLAGLLLLASPAHVRLSRMSDPSISYTFFLLAALVAYELVRARRDLWLLLAAGVLWGLAASMRQEAPVSLLILAARVALDPERRRDLWSPGRLLALAAPIAVIVTTKTVAMFSLGAYNLPSMAHETDFYHYFFQGRGVFRETALTWLAIPGLAFLGLRRGAVVGVGAFLCSALVLAVACWTDRYSGYRYFIAYVPFVLAAAAAGMTGLIDKAAALLRRPEAARLAALTLFVPPAVLLQGLPDVQERNVIQAEHAFLANAVHAVAPPAVIVLLHVDGHASGAQAVYALGAAGIPARLAQAFGDIGTVGADVVVFETTAVDDSVFSFGVPVYALRGWIEIEALNFMSGTRGWQRALDATFVRRIVRCEVRPKPPLLPVNGEIDDPDAQTQRFCIEQLSRKPASDPAVP